MAYQDFLLDKRIVQRHIDKGIVDPKMLEKALKELPDRADNVATTHVETAEGGQSADEGGAG